jgi:tetratricopeptide (TPR) repeat protein
MRAGMLGFAIAALCALAFSGCSRVGDYAAIVRANGLHDRGLYQEAVAAYLSVHSGSFGPTVDYDLANVYARLGEAAAAAALYDRARAGGGPAIRADSFFNQGILLYEKGRYEDSWRAFRSALSTARDAGLSDSSPFVQDGRRNLELAWRAWQKTALSPPQTISPSRRGADSGDDAELRLLRRLETGRWRPGLKSQAEAGPDDY